MLRTLTPAWVETGIITSFSSSLTRGRSVAPKMRAMLGPVMSASRMPQGWPSRTKAQASWAVTLLLPTPPLPEPTAMTWGTFFFKRLMPPASPVIFPSVPVDAGWPEPMAALRCSPRRFLSMSSSTAVIAPMVRCTFSDASTEVTASVTSRRIWSFRGQASMVTSMRTLASWPSSSTCFTMPRSTMDCPSSGSITFFKRSRISSRVAIITPWI